MRNEYDNEKYAQMSRSREGRPLFPDQPGIRDELRRPMMLLVKAKKESQGETVTKKGSI